MRLLIKNGRVIDPASQMDAIRDILIQDGKIIDAGEHIRQDADKIIDAKDCWVVPGLIDIHVHLREPGFEHKETIESGSRSAAKGGFTTICCMPNTLPVIDSAHVVKYITDKAKAKGLVHVLPIGSITKGQQGEELVDVEKLAAAGVCAISEDGKTVMNSTLLQQAMECSKAVDIPILAHCEDHSLIQGGAMNLGRRAAELGIKGMAKEAEEVVIARDIMLASITGVKLHICHISTMRGVQLVRDAKGRGEFVTAEVSPHHFTLTEEIVEKEFTNAKMNPPLRSKADVEALKLGLADGTIDIIATDHAPHHENEKNQEFHNAPFGIVGLETSLPLGITELVEPGLLTPSQLIEKMTTNPAKLLNINKGTLKIGRMADVTIIDPKSEYTIDVSTFASKSNNSPFHDRKVKGKVVHTIVNGKLVVENGLLVL